MGIGGISMWQLLILLLIVVLVFGLMAVTNLLLVAASSNTVANQGTAAVTAATQVMDFLKATTYDTLDNLAGGTAFSSTDGGLDCNDPALIPTSWHCSTSSRIHRLRPSIESWWRCANRCA